MNFIRKLTQRAANLVLGASLLAGSALGFGCNRDPDVYRTFTEGRVFAGGLEIEARTLNSGHDAYMLYCYACHGTKGDGKGPSSYGLRPPPRDFTKAIFKFARLRSSDELPHDEDLIRIIKGGLHGTAMLPWDIPEIELYAIVQYIKTFAPQKWEKKKKSGELVKTLEPFEAPPDPWVGKKAEAVQLGKELYHLRAECLNCHPGYDTKESLYKMSVEAAKRDPAQFKALGGFRDDLYRPVAKDSPEYGVKILPPDFLLNPLRSVQPQTSVVDLYRVLAYGVYPIMPAWKGAGLSDSDIYALAYYVDSLVDLRNTKDGWAMKDQFTKQAAFEIPAAQPVEPAPTEGAPAEGDKAAEGDKKAEEKAGEKPAEKKEEKPAEKKPAEQKPAAPKPPGAAPKPPAPPSGGDVY